MKETGGGITKSGRRGAGAASSSDIGGPLYRIGCGESKGGIAECGHARRRTDSSQVETSHQEHILAIQPTAAGQARDYSPGRRIRQSVASAGAHQHVDRAHRPMTHPEIIRPHS